MSVQVTNPLDLCTSKGMSPITFTPHSAGGAELPNSRSKNVGSPQRMSNGYTPPKSNGILSPRKSSKRFFRRPTLEKSPPSDTSSAQSSDKKKQSTQPKVEIIYREARHSRESEESKVDAIKRTFENDGSPRLRPTSLHSGERTPSTISDEFVPGLLSIQEKDINMNRISTGSSTCSHTERVVQEILCTEQAYVQHLHEIIEGYLKKMRSKESPFPAQDIKDLFMNIEEIYEFNKEFLTELEECGDDPVDIASCFVSKEKGFKTYTDYCTNYPLSMEVLTKSTQHKKTADYIKKIQIQLGHSLPLGSYLLKPVQRILKYHLLLQDIQKHFDEENFPEDCEVISDALNAMTGVAHHINEMKRKHEVAVHVQEIQSQMSDFEGPDLTTYGNLVLEDSFRLHGSRTDRYLFLFEKILLITKRRESGYSCKATLMLSNMMLLESVPKEPLSFEIIRFDNQKVTYTFLARNSDQKRKWTLELKGLIVDSLAASVPKEAKDLILGKEKMEVDKEKSGTLEGKKRVGSFHKRNKEKPKITRTSFVKKKPEMNKRPEDECEPRSPSDAYSSDDDKISIRPPSLNSDREEDIDECEEITEDDSLLSPDISIASQGDAELAMESTDLEEEDREQNDQAPEKSTEEATLYPIEDPQGEVVGTAHGDVVKDEAKGEESSPEKDLTQEMNEVKRTPPVLRKRSNSVSKCEGIKKACNKSSTSSMSDDEGASERVSLDFTRRDIDSPRMMRRSSSGHRLLEAMLSSERSSSVCDLRCIEEDSSSVFSCSEITSLHEYSAITTTVRKVSRAFSGSSSPAEKSPSSEIQMRTAQTQYIVESANSHDKRLSLSSSDSSRNNLEEFLASIDRDLDETRRTISCAQLLESALLIKNDSQPLATEGKPTDSPRRRRRQRIVDFSSENGDESPTGGKRSNLREKRRKSLRKSRDQDEMDSNVRESQKPHETECEDLSEVKSSSIDEEELFHEGNTVLEPNATQDSPIEAVPEENQVEQDSQVHNNHVESKPQDDQAEEFPRAENTLKKKRVFELFAESNSGKGGQRSSSGVLSSETVTNPEQTTLSEPTLPSVYQLAKQYSQLVSDKQAVEQIRMSSKAKLCSKAGSVLLEKTNEGTLDRTPKIKIEKITKVSLTSSPIESYKLVRRRRRRSSRHRSDDIRRQSWSVEKVKPDQEEPRKARPKSAYDMDALEATIAENLEQIEEGLEPMLIAGLDQDDFVVRGLVQHLVKKFNSQKVENS